MKKELKNAPPEPREPAAREAVEQFWEKWEDCDSINFKEVAVKFALAYSAELRAAHQREIVEFGNAINGKWMAWGVVEVAIRNPQVADYCKHWEERAEAAEARVKELETADIQRAKDITRLTIERDLALSERDEFSRMISDLHKTAVDNGLIPQKASTSAPEGR